ncbi:MAG: VpsP family polysaccharide biosynthesis protein [Glaciecola sp.]
MVVKHTVISSAFLRLISHKHNLLVTLFLMLLGFALVYSAIALWSSLLKEEVKNSLISWQEKGEVVNLKDIDSAKRALSTLERLNPVDPLVMDMFGQVYEWESFTTEKELPGSLQRAKVNYRKAIAKRPTWAVSHASLALVKWRLQEFDTELESALLNAMKYGPRKPEVHLVVSQFGLATYQANHPYYAIVRENLPFFIYLALQGRETEQKMLDIINYQDSVKSVCRWFHIHRLDASTTSLKCN